ncbi:11641_t:CDS:2 [Funneliformis geosporum]|uniref:7144_t:CDS:1 n=1 Tax=Funneliformis geosporum TaxID=1117311 RepID=A0A9W4WZ71_9GLOM|nr:7144_t:CDS:2 [Funneliformis geosporum]CAI2190739.1 11641_t:CDS:2 [Funneliformis geosporum]
MAEISDTSPKNIGEMAINGAGVALDTSTTIIGVIEGVINITVPFAKFVPLIADVANILDQIVDLYQSAEHNKRICGVLIDRVSAAEAAVRNLKIRRDQNKTFFNQQNLILLQRLVHNIQQIRRFVNEVSQVKGLKKYAQAKSIEKSFNELCRDFDSHVATLHFAITVDSRNQAENDKEALRNDLADLSKYLDDIGSGITDNNKHVAQLVTQLIVMNSTMENLHAEQIKNNNTESQGKIDNIFKEERLPLNDYKPTHDDRGSKVKKWISKKTDDEVAFKAVADENDLEEYKNSIKNQVTILKKLKDCQSILRFYGIASDGEKWYTVTEWAELGNLREYYNKYDFDIRKKLSFAVDIARGLNFLKSIEIIHRDIRAENILITANETAKIANFKSSRNLAHESRKQNATQEAVRYLAPEMLGQRTVKYTTKCEVYSFGILLWEIAEQKVPYEKLNDIIHITDLVKKEKYREPFSLNSDLPKKYREIAKEGFYIPELSKMFNTLIELFKNHGLPQASPRPSFTRIHPRVNSTETFALTPQDESELMIEVPDLSPFNYMSVDEASKQHKIKNGNLEMAYKCFDTYANLGNLKAKYFRAYYISHNYAETHLQQQDRDEIAARLYKEVADAGDEYPEAQLRYGNCLYKGQGVPKNIEEAVKYFVKSAENDQEIGMYNAGSLYHIGGLIEQNRELGEYYMKLAAYKQHQPAIDFCKKYNIPL